MAIKDWRACEGVNARTGRVRQGYRTVKGKCPVPAHHTPSLTDLVTPGITTAASLGRAAHRRRRR